LKNNLTNNKERNHQIYLEKYKQQQNQDLENIKNQHNLAIEELKQNKTQEVEELKILNSMWLKTIETQMHFNEMAAKARQLGLSFAVAAIGLVLVSSMKSETTIKVTITVLNRSINLSAAFCIFTIAAIAVYAVSILDTGVYHNMLRGAVSFGEDLESNPRLRKITSSELGLTESVSLFSRHKYVKKHADRSISKGKKITALDKIKKFYRFIISVLIIFALVSFVMSQGN